MPPPPPPTHLINKQRLTEYCMSLDEIDRGKEIWETSCQNLLSI